ncbi:hypothetical protein VP01_9184g1, partial [Puccinia sorghi]
PRQDLEKPGHSYSPCFGISKTKDPSKPWKPDQARYAVDLLMALVTSGTKYPKLNLARLSLQRAERSTYGEPGGDKASKEELSAGIMGATSGGAVSSPLRYRQYQRSMWWLYKLALVDLGGLGREK